jgi:signal transduction histidine kinase/CHASE2 domain-containing sensor protein
MPDKLPVRGSQWPGTLALIFVSAMLGIAAEWLMPGVDRYARDVLMRARGALPPPDEIVLVAIDEQSIRRLGRFPWPRSIMARTIDAVAAGRPKVIALDVLYTDPTREEEDSSLAAAIRHAGNVVAASQLLHSHGGGTAARWLLPLPSIRSAAAGVGHVNVQADSDGTAREVLIRVSDDEGHWFQAMPIETIRVADGVPPGRVTHTEHAVLAGSRKIPVAISARSVLIGQSRSTATPPQILRATRMMIDYSGPAGSFSSTTYSVADVLAGTVPAAKFTGRYVLIGATAGSLGDRFASPFTNHTDIQGNQHGSFMPGVEVLANALNTILRSRFYTEAPGWMAFAWAALLAALTLALLSLAQGRMAFLSHVAVLAGVAAGIVLVTFFAFTGWLVILPITTGIVAFAASGLLGLLRRALITSSRLDAAIGAMARVEDIVTPKTAPPEAVERIARLANAAAVAILLPRPAGECTVVANCGFPVALRPDAPPESASASEFFALPCGLDGEFQVARQAMSVDGQAALLVTAHRVEKPSAELLRVCAAIAESCISSPPGKRVRNYRQSRWPRGLESKAAFLARLNDSMIERTRFVDLALRSVEDGLIITGVDGHITFANRSAASVLESTESSLVGVNLFERLRQCQPASTSLTAGELLARLLVDHAHIEREITVGISRQRQFVLRMSPVSTGADGGRVLGIVASFSDVTRQNELQQTKNDVISLVSHEMRTPLSAIQGMSELLVNYDLDPRRRQELSLAINDEARRLTSMITEYLDITRLESGATVVRRGAVLLDTLLERTLLSLEPLAARREIRLVRQFTAAAAPVLLADPELLWRAVANLVSNAIKYSPPGTEVFIRASDGSGGVTIDVVDQGYGIPAQDLGRIFDKFYRVPRVENGDISGTGLGLALVREIAELHGGTVGVKSEPGSGSTFSLHFPHSEEEK